MPTAPILSLCGLIALIITPAHASGSCAPYPYADTGVLAADIALLNDALADFPALGQILDTARPEICTIAGTAEALGTYGAEDNRITLAIDQPQHRRVAVLIHELRHVDQYQRGICPPDGLEMRANARAMFALEADAMAITHLVAWASLAAGRPEIFAALRDAPETSDIAAAFETEMTASADVARATAAAFDAWYASDLRRERYYISTCMAYLERTERAHSLPGSAPLTADFLAHVCNLPDRTAYPCTEPDDPLPR